MTVEEADLIASLMSTTCPVCGMRKGKKKSLCLMCYKEVPRDIRARLYDLVGEGYEEAMAAAMKALGRTEFLTGP